MIVQRTTSDQYLTTGKVSTRSILKLRRYKLVKTLPKILTRNRRSGRRRRGDCNSSSFTSYMRAKNGPVHSEKKQV